MVTDEYLNFVGVDPGFHGAIGRISLDGQRLSAWDLPVTRSDNDKSREFDLPALAGLIKTLRRLPGVTVGLEFPTTRPGEGAERSKRFGHGLGLLEGMLFIRGVSYRRIPPNLWKGRLGVPGKTEKGAVAASAAFFDLYYPAYHDLIRGPHGGLLDGRIDALLIAHYLRTRELGGVQAIVKTYGKGSDQALMFLLAGGRKGRKKSFQNHLPLGES